MKKDLKKNVEIVQEMQDEIFRKMSVTKKIRVTFGLNSLCSKLNSIHGNTKPRKTSSRHN